MHAGFEAAKSDRWNQLLKEDVESIFKAMSYKRHSICRQIPQVQLTALLEGSSDHERTAFGTMLFLPPPLLPCTALPHWGNYNLSGDNQQLPNLPNIELQETARPKSRARSQSQTASPKRLWPRHTGWRRIGYITSSLCS